MSEKREYTVFEFKELDLLLFKYILHHFGRRWEKKYPKALDNIWGKLFLLQVSNELSNKQ